MKKVRLPEARPRLCFVAHGSRNPGYTPTPGEILSDLFEDAGYGVISVSASLNRYMRLADIVSTIIRRRSSIDVLVLDVYGERSFIVEDVASRVGQRLGLRVVMYLHGGTLPEFMARFPIWTRRVLSRADALVTPSKFLARAVLSHGFQTQVIPNVIDLSAYEYRHRQKVGPIYWGCAPFTLTTILGWLFRFYRGCEPQCRSPLW